MPRKEKKKKKTFVNSKLINKLKVNIDKIMKKSKDVLVTNKTKAVITACAALILVTGITIINTDIGIDTDTNSVNDTNELLATSLMSIDKTNEMYNVYYEDYLVGSVAEASLAEDTLDDVISQLNIENNQVYALPSALVVEPSKDLSKNEVLDEKAFKDALYKMLVAHIDELLIEVFVVEVENGTQVILDNYEDVKSTLTRVTRKYLPEGEDFEVTQIDVNNTDEDTIVFEKQEDEELLALAAEATPKMLRTTMGEGDEASLVEPQASVVSDTQESEYEEGVKDVGFADAVNVSTKFVKQQEIGSVQTAYETLTAFEEEQVIYSIQAGDNPSEIAERYGMGLSELYALNPGLKENANRIQIGQELIITRPNPNLSVETKEILTYQKSYNSEPIIEYDDTKYTTYYYERNTGSEGIKEITAEVVKVDGEAVDEEVLDEVVVEEPDPKIIVRGTLTPPQFINPLPSGYVSSWYGPRWGSFHRGLDIAGSYGTSIRASASGTIEYAGWMNGYGYLVIINHGNGFKTYYAHCSKLYVYVGQYVKQGSTISAVGSTGDSTGNHVHFEIRYYGEFRNPANYIF